MQGRLKFAAIVTKTRTEFYSCNVARNENVETRCRGNMLHRAIIQQVAEKIA